MLLMLNILIELMTKSMTNPQRDCFEGTLSANLNEFALRRGDVLGCSMKNCFLVKPCVGNDA